MHQACCLQDLCICCSLCSNALSPDIFLFQSLVSFRCLLKKYCIASSLLTHLENINPPFSLPCFAFIHSSWYFLTCKFYLPSFPSYWSVKSMETRYFSISFTANSSMPQTVTGTNYWVNKQMNGCLDTVFWNCIAGGLNEGGTKFGVVPWSSCWCAVITVSIETKWLWPNSGLETLPLPFALSMFLDWCVTVIES